MTIGTANTAKKQRGKPFEPGKSGNPAGKPRGSRNATTLAAEALLDGEADALTRKAIEMAKSGDMQALRLCMDRILPPRKDRPITFTLPEITSSEQAVTTIAAVLSSVAAGDVTPVEAGEIGKLIEVYVRSVETNDLAKRIEQLERTAPK